MKLNEIVPWGRKLEEYKLMFNLSETDLKAKIIGCGDGPASFNAEMRKKGYSVISIDPIYQFSAAQIKQRIDDTYNVIIAQVKQNSDGYIWQNFSNPDELGQVRLETMENFLLDYERGKKEGRYLYQSLPNLALGDDQFQLSLCSHLLFLYSDQLSLEFHIASIYELLRISLEVRIFPLLKLNCEPSPYIESVIKEFSGKGFKVEIQPVAYEFQKGGNQMLKISKIPLA